MYADTVRLKLRTGNEVQAFVRLAGAGAHRPRCLLLHGNPGTLEDWQRIVPRIESAADVLAIDLPGFGQSPPPGCNAQCLNLDHMAEYALAAADALGWHEPFFVVGHSHGGGIAQTLAVRHPRRVAGLVLIASMGALMRGSYQLLSLPGATGLARALGRGLRSERLLGFNRRVARAVMRDIFSPEPVSPERLERELTRLRARPEILLSVVQVALGRPCQQLVDQASEIRCSTLFLHGERDRLMPARCAQAIHEHILSAGGRSRFELLPDTGHMLLEYQASSLSERIRASFVPG